MSKKHPDQILCGEWTAHSLREVGQSVNRDWWVIEPHFVLSHFTIPEAKRLAADLLELISRCQKHPHQEQEAK